MSHVNTTNIEKYTKLLKELVKNLRNKVNLIPVSNSRPKILENLAVAYKKLFSRQIASLRVEVRKILLSFPVVA